MLSAVFLLLAAANTAKAQNWTWQNPKPQGNNLYEVCFPDANTGYAAGLDGTILKTTNAGISWTTQNTGTAASLSSVYFINADTGYAIGTSTLLKTTDGGLNWISLAIGIPYLTSVFFTSADTGYVVGGSGSNGVIMKTTNGGLNWTAQSSGSNPFYNSVFFYNDSTGYVVGNGGKILKTTNGGNTWTAQTSGVTNSLYSVFFTTANTGYASEYGRILRTTNGGLNWSYITIYQSYELYSLYFTDSLNGYAVGRSGKILKTTNAGANWAFVTSGTSINLNSVCFTDSTTAYAVGDNGIILKTIDGGINWTAFTGSTYYTNLNDICFPNACTGYSIGNQGVVLKTTNGGTDWTAQNSGISSILNSVFFINDDIGFAVGDSGKIIKTINGGTNWMLQSSGITQSLYSVFFTGIDTGYAVGISGIILRTINGGTNWTVQSSGVSNNLLSVYFINANTGFAAGSSGRVLKTSDGGINWNILYSGTTLDLKAVYFPTADTGYIAGVSGHIRKTVNGGTNWTQLSNNINIVLTSLNFSNANTGYAVGYDYNHNGKIYQTVNGGTNWAVQSISPEHDLKSVKYADDRTVYIAGSNGTILKSIIGTATAGNNGPICEGDTLELSASSIPGATFVWSGPGGFSSTLPNPIVSTNSTAAMSGIYTVSTAINACTNLNQTTIVSVSPAPAPPTAANNGPICEGDTLTLSASSIAGATFNWTGPGGFSSTDQNPTVSTNSTAAMSGTYYVAANVNACSSSAAATTVTVNSIPSAPTAGNNGPLCEGDTLTLSASSIAGATFNWTGPGGFSTTDQNPTVSTNSTTTMSGTYYVSASVNACTSSAATTIVTVNAIPSAPIAGNNGPIAVGSTLTLSASGISGANYIWMGPSGFTAYTQNPTVSTNATAAMAGYYKVKAIVNGCSSLFDSTLVIINPVTNDSACGLQEFWQGITAPAGWIFNGLGSPHTSAAYAGQNPPAMNFDGNGASITSADVYHPSLLSFWIKGAGTDNNSALVVKGLDGTNWVVIDSIVPLPTSGTTKTYSIITDFSKFQFTYFKSAGNLAFDDVNVTCVTNIGFESIRREDSYTIYPNPNSGIFHIKTDMVLSNALVEIFDNFGKLQHRQNISGNNGSTTVDISGLAKGMYFVIIKDEATIIHVSKIIKN